MDSTYACELRTSQRCSEYSHMSEYAAFLALLFLAFHPPQRAGQP